MSETSHAVSKLPAPRSRLPSLKHINGRESNTAGPSKRVHDGVQLIAESPKRLKQENHRVAALSRQKAARRSVSNALKISRNKATREASGLVQANRSTNPSHMTRRNQSHVSKPPLKTAQLPKQPLNHQKFATISSTTTTKSCYETGKSKMNSKTKSVSRPDKKRASRISNSSTSSAGSTVTVSKKPKRKPWDLKGQIADLKEELAASKEKVVLKEAFAQENEATLKGILRRLEALESEKRSINEERSVLSGDVIELQQKVADKRKRVMELESELEDVSRQLRSSRKMCDEQDYDLRQARKEKSDLMDQMEKINSDHRTLQQSFQEHQEITKKLRKELEDSRQEAFRLEMESKAMEEDRRKLLNLVQELKGNIRVFCRVRPLLEEEEKEVGKIDHIEFVGNNEKSLVILNDADKPSTYTFDRVFNTLATQEKVFSEVHQLVESALDGYNVCIFAYGQTGAGKTYTMEGNGGIDTPTAGIIPRAVKLMLNKCEEKQRFGWEYKLSVQHVQIYQETLQDLLQPNDDSNKLEIKTITSGGKQKIWVKNLSEHPVSNFKQIKNLLEGSKTKRVTASTAANARSSRSHSVFIMKISGNNANTQEKIEASLNLIDLAGSERVAETGSSGTRLQEAKKINGSLTQLSNVISSLANKESHVPYRNSKLTFLLMDSLGGNSKTLMLVNVNPTRRATSETINTLRFATTVNKCHIGTAQKIIKF